MVAVQNLNTEELRAYAKMLRLSNLRSNGQSAQAVATQIAAALDSIARRIA